MSDREHDAAGPAVPVAEGTRTTFVSFLLDETGSMGAIRDDTIEGFNAYADRLQSGGADILFSLVSFNSNHTRRRYVAVPITEVSPLTPDGYVPDAMTPLIDACVKIIRATEEAVENRPDDPKVVIVVQTDGHENVSVEFTSRDLAGLVKEKTAAGWQFVFLGAGLDAFDVARKAGLDMAPEQVVSYGRDHSRDVFASVAENVADYAEGGDAKSLRFSDQQRSTAGDHYTGRYLGRDRSGKKPKSTIEEIDLTK